MVDARELCKRAVKYILEGLMVAVAALVLPQKSLKFDDILGLAFVAADFHANHVEITLVLFVVKRKPLEIGIEFSFTVRHQRGHVSASHNFFVTFESSAGGRGFKVNTTCPGALIGIDISCI